MMFFLNGNGMELINSDYIERFCIVEKSDATLVVASYNQDRRPVTLGRYKDVDTARAALENLQLALHDNKGFYSMDESCTGKDVYKPRNGYHGNRRRSHGGS